LSNKNGFESIKLKRQKADFFPYTIDDKCCRVYSETEFEGEYEDLCLNLNEGLAYLPFTGWKDQLPILSYKCTNPGLYISLKNEDSLKDNASGTTENRNTKQTNLMTEVSVVNEARYPRWITLFDEYECQGHSFFMEPDKNRYSDDLAKIANIPGYYLNSPDQIKSISVPYSFTVTVYDEPN